MNHNPRASWRPFQAGLCRVYRIPARTPCTMLAELLDACIVHAINARCFSVARNSKITSYGCGPHTRYHTPWHLSASIRPSEAVFSSVPVILTIRDPSSYFSGRGSALDQEGSVRISLGSARISADWPPIEVRLSLGLARISGW